MREGMRERVHAKGLSLDDLARGVAAGERPALARALSLAERDPVAAADLLSRLADKRGRAHVVGITGPPGAGKSTLVGALLRHLVHVGQRVAVLAVDPSSPVTGGALLGDRFRIGESVADERSFIRSTATRGSLGGLTNAARQMVELMDAAGFDLVLVETVGTGQSEIDVARLADSTLVVFPPGLGDELQAIKAGILELADFLVVSKSDTAAASQAFQALQAVAPLWRSAPPIHAVSALTGDGILALAEAVLASARTPSPLVRRGAVGILASMISLSEAFLEIQARIGSRLPASLLAGVSMHVVNNDTTFLPSSLQFVCSFVPGADSFKMGAATGATIAVAAEMNLLCVVTAMDAGAGTVSMLLQPMQA